MKNKFAAKAFSNWIFTGYRNILRHPKWGWCLVLASLVYLLDPFDALPDFVPFVGLVDDGLIVTVLVSEVSRMMSDRLKAQKNKFSTGVTTDATPSVIDVKSVSVS
jgi:uncharacterized membrane protein YkvA (DUF1232 family)